MREGLRQASWLSFNLVGAELGQTQWRCLASDTGGGAGISWGSEGATCGCHSIVYLAVTGVLGKPFVGWEEWWVGGQGERSWWALIVGCEGRWVLSKVMWGYRIFEDGDQSWEWMTSYVVMEAMSYEAVGRERSLGVVWFEGRGNKPLVMRKGMRGDGLWSRRWRAVEVQGRSSDGAEVSVGRTVSPSFWSVI